MATLDGVTISARAQVCVPGIVRANAIRTRALNAEGRRLSQLSAPIY